MRRFKLTLLIGLSVCVWGSPGLSAQAAKRTVTLPTYPIQRIATFKAKNTKVYSYPRAKHPQSKYLGHNRSTKRKWTVLKVVRVRGKRYVKITPDRHSYLQHGSTFATFYTPGPLDGGYVPFSRLRMHRQILRMPAMKRTAYWMPTIANDFWDMPAGTLGLSSAINYGRSYAYRTLYAVQSLTTVRHRHYLYFETAKGEEIGWLPTDAVVKGVFSDVLHRELTRNFNAANATTKVTTIDKGRHVKVGVITRDNRTQRVVLADQNSETTIFDWQDGHVTTRTQRLANGHTVKIKHFKTAATAIAFQAEATDERGGVTYEITVTNRGAVSVKIVGVGVV
ncbi:GW dipeptide domain-containing protein [Levilactobacillus sp. N40-8-2]|uniref:GW dipeptide domain-containing protein n=1 Tax=Levilactobacillus muriae TaxID=3238987 RepID=UPI0038B3E496